MLLQSSSVSLSVQRFHSDTNRLVSFTTLTSGPPTGSQWVRWKTSWDYTRVELKPAVTLSSYHWLHSWKSLNKCFWLDRSCFFFSADGSPTRSTPAKFLRIEELSLQFALMSLCCFPARNEHRFQRTSVKWSNCHFVFEKVCTEKGSRKVITFTAFCTS